MSFLLRYLPWTLLHKDEKELDEDVDIILIGAGLPRTGTKSTHAALSQLLPGKCHHMGLSATVDYPSAYFWRKLMECQGAVDRQRPCKMVPLSQEQHLPRMSADCDASFLNHHLPIRWPSY